MIAVEVFDTKARRHRLAVLRLAKWLVKKLAQNGSVEIFLVGDKFMQKNVLAFPAPKNFPRPDLGQAKPLGEIYLNPTHIKQREENLNYLLIHGFLHLLGYDHVKKNDRMMMERKEKRLLNKYDAKNL